MAENRSKKREHPTSLDNLGDEYALTVPELATILKMSRVKMNEMLATGKIEGDEGTACTAPPAGMIDGAGAVVPA